MCAKFVKWVSGGRVGWVRIVEARIAARREGGRGVWVPLSVV